jgi:hypothetical protein
MMDQKASCSCLDGIHLDSAVIGAVMEGPVGGSKIFVVNGCL